MIPHHATTSLMVLSLLLATACGDKEPTDDTAPPAVDADGDGYDAAEDCDDTDPTAYPGAEEVCDLVDNDCDGETDEGTGDPWYPDADGDGFGDESSMVEACEQPSGHVEGGDDCDDDDPDTHPGAEERCDGVDNDCDGDIDDNPLETWYADADGDGWGNASFPIDSCDPGEGWVASDTDCDDLDPDTYPDADELCDEIDNDCDGTVDEDLAELWYADADADGYGDPEATTDECNPGDGWVADSNDCDDTDASTHPDADELCDGVDNDCDETIDDDDDDAVDPLTWYLDADADGYGLDTDTTTACTQPSGYADLGGDCDDDDSAYNPGAIESDCTDPADYNCDGSVGYDDDDGDGYAACEECDDTDDTIFPGTDELCDGVDNDCDGDVDEDDAIDATTYCDDADGDGYGDAANCTMACTAPAGWTVDASDCDDTAATVHPGAEELCNGIDDDCDSLMDGLDPDITDLPTWYADGDGDGYGDASIDREACSQPTGFVADDTDCDDGDGTVNPAATEACNGVDDDCDTLTDDDDTAVTGTTTWWLDYDSDGYGAPTISSESCTQPSSHVDSALGEDCDDLDASAYPGADEQCDGADNDCDGTVDEDSAIDATTWYADTDADGYGDAASPTDACSQPTDHVADSTDCDDADASVFPGGTEICDGADNDCDGSVDEDDATDTTTWYADGDADGYGDGSTPTDACSQPTNHVADSTDCDDTSASTNPGATEYCDGLDNDCDGTTDEADAADVTTWYADDDDDGFGNSASSTDACAQPTGYVLDDSDCDDNDDDVYPTAAEYCNGTDDDCDGTTDETDAVDTSTWYADADGDSYGDTGSTTAACDQPTGHVASSTDCDDTIAAINPGATEICDGVDNDCDGTTDEDSAADASTWYADADDDGYGTTLYTDVACSQPSGYVSDDNDCDDTEATTNPAASDPCIDGADGVDNDCDGIADDDDADIYFADLDMDSFGDPSNTLLSCEPVDGYVEDDRDCDDSDALVHPYAWEDDTDGIDNDCDELIDTADTDIPTSVTLNDDDAEELLFSSVTFPFCGADYTSVWLGSNGRMTFYGSDVDWTESSTEFLDDGPAIAPFWQDLYPSGGVEVAWMEYADAVGIYFRQVPRCCTTYEEDSNTFSVVLMDDGTVLMDWDGIDQTIALVGWSCSTDSSVVTEDLSTLTPDYPAGTIGSDSDDALYQLFTSSSAFDLDGFALRFWTSGFDADGDGSSAFDDCDDTDPSISPSATEVCDGVDNDCDGDTDEGEDLARDASGQCAMGTSCDDMLAQGYATDGVYTIAPGGLGAGEYAFEVYCDQNTDGGGWTLLLSADGSSSYWGNSSVNWWDIAADTAPSSLTDTDYHGPAYDQLPTDEVRLCYDNTSSCYSFVHGYGISLFDFFDGDITYTEYSYLSDGHSDVGSDSSRTDYLAALGLTASTVHCSWLGINEPYSISAIGLLGDENGGCSDISDTYEYYDDLALGLGLQSCEDTNGCPNGGTENLAGTSSRVGGVTASGVYGPWFVFGR